MIARSVVRQALQTASRQSQRSSSSYPTMSNKTDAYLIPIDPTQPKTVAPGIAIDKLWASGRPTDKAEETRLFYVDKDTSPADLVSVVSLGSKIGKAKENAKNEAVRRASGLAARALKDAGAKSVAVDASLGAHATAVGTYLGLHKFTLKTKKDPNPDIEFKPLENSLSESGGLGWDTGVQYAKAQILARELMELPANFITPTAFCERVKKEFEGVANVTIHVRDAAWAEQQGMRTFLSVTKGTSEPAKFLELHYHGAASKDEQPIVFVGKGITFDSGGISIKPAADMKLMRGDMGGAATVVSAALAIAKLRLPVNLVVLTPLTENLLGPAATKPGDIIYAMNGKTVEVDNTDAEGRLVLSDALTYGSRTFNPHTIVDVATLTGAMVIALGDLYTGVFSTSDSLWEELHTAGEAEHDRFWRMPLDEDYGPQIYSSNADLCNTGGRPAGSCTAALFLKAFVEGIEPEEGAEQARIRWAHLDIAGTMDQLRGGPYQHKGMTGRPVRALVEFVRRSSQKK